MTDAQSAAKISVTSSVIRLDGGDVQRKAIKELHGEGVDALEVACQGLNGEIQNTVNLLLSTRSESIGASNSLSPSGLTTAPSLIGISENGSKSPSPRPPRPSTPVPETPSLTSANGQTRLRAASNAVPKVSQGGDSDEESKTAEGNYSSSDTTSSNGSSNPSASALDTSSHLAPQNYLSGLADSTRACFVGTVFSTSNGPSYGSMMSIENVDFASGHLLIILTRLAHISSSKKSNCYIEMEISCGGLKWKHLRTDSEFLKLHEKILTKLPGKSDQKCPLKSQRANRFFASVKELKPSSTLGLRSRRKSVDDADEYGAAELMSEMQVYVDFLVTTPELLSHPKFRDFLDPTNNPSAWLMKMVSKKTGQLTIKDHPECYCAIYAGSLYVFKDMASEKPILVIDLLCAKIDYVSLTPNAEGRYVFFIKVDDNEKEKYIFEARSQDVAEYFVVNCRKARREEAISSSELLSYAQSLKLKPLPPSKASISLIPSPSPSSDIPQSIFATADKAVPTYEEDNDSNTRLSASGEFMGATIDKLLDKVIEGVLDKTAFLRCFPKVIEPLPLLKKLRARIFHPKNDEFRFQTIDLLVAWHQTFPSDFQREEMPRVLTTVIEKAKTLNLTSDVLATLLSLSDPAILTSPHSGSSLGEMERPASLLPLCFGEGKFDVYDLHPMEIARQSTIVAVNLYRRITMRELTAWGSPDEATLCPNIMALMNHLNYLSSFFSTYIMSGCNAKQRGYYLRHCIDILNAAVEIRNFHLVFGILAALESSHVSRLKKTWAFLDSPREQLLNSYRTQFSPDANYRSYRELVGKGPQPTLPAVAIFMKDIFFIDEGNKNFIEGTDLVNWFKFPILSNSIAQLENAHSVRYPFTTVTEIRSFLAEYKVFPKNDLWMLSLTIEPRENK